MIKQQAIVIIVQKDKQLKLLCELTRVRMCKAAFFIHHRDIKWTFKAEIMSGLSLEKRKK